MKMRSLFIIGFACFAGFASFARGDRSELEIVHYHVFSDKIQPADEVLSSLKRLLASEEGLTGNAAMRRRKMYEDLIDAATLDPLKCSKAEMQKLLQVSREKNIYFNIYHYLQDCFDARLSYCLHTFEKELHDSAENLSEEEKELVHKLSSAVIKGSSTNLKRSYGLSLVLHSKQYSAIATEYMHSKISSSEKLKSDQLQRKLRDHIVRPCTKIQTSLNEASKSFTYVMKKQKTAERISDETLQLLIANLLCSEMNNYQHTIYNSLKKDQRIGKSFWSMFSKH